MDNQISPKDYEIAAQFAHFFTAAFLVSQLGRFGEWKLWAAAVGMVSFAAIKEFWYDSRHANPLVRGASPLDFAMYLAGTATAVALGYIR